MTESSDLLLPFAAVSVGVARRRLVSDLLQAGVRGSVVTDGGAQTAPELGEPDLSTTGGRGLRIVERLSVCWGTHHDGEGTTVWAEVPVPQLTAVAVSGAGAGLN